MRVDVPWSTGTVPVDIDGARVAGVLGANVERAADPEGVLRAALEARGAGLKAFLREASSPLLVVVNDATRPTPSAEVLRVIRNDLEEWLAAGDPPRSGAAPAGSHESSPDRSAAMEPAGRDLSLLVATGTHRAALPEELEHIFGKEFLAAHAGRISSHDAKDKTQLVQLGRTSRGTEVQANRLLAEARSILLINSVEPHYFAGYTGGRKSLFPGVAGYETVWANHALSMKPGSESLVLDGNPVNEDLEEALAIGIEGRQVFSIQLVLDKDHRVGFAAAGPLGDTFLRAVDVADRQFVLDLERRYEVVVAVAPHPMDCNFYQTNKAIQSGALAVAHGGILIVVSECPFGLGENQTLYDMLAASRSPAEALARADQEEYRLGVQQATRIAGVLQRADIWAVTSLPEDQVRSMFMKPFATVQQAVDAGLDSQGPGAQVLFLTEASITVPRPRSAV
jgi:lactate racemase